MWLVLRAAFEWEDDFSALEKSCHFQYDGHSHSYSLLQTHNRTAQSRPENGRLPQTCLFLTYVTESDLEWDKGEWHANAHTYWAACGDFDETW